MTVVKRDTGLRTCLMEGSVWHKRFTPRVHAFRYRVFYLRLDLEELDRLARKSRFFSVDRFNLFSFRPADYGLHRAARKDGDGPLKDRVVRFLKSEFPDAAVDRIELLTMPRVLGYAFNPLSIYYCYGAADVLSHVIYEVNNTFGERISYAFAVERHGDKLAPHGCAKELHVSPFFEVEGGYRFRQELPEAALKIAIDYLKDSDTGRPQKAFSAAMSLQKKEFSTRNLLHLFLQIPFVTIKVTAAIHWQALLLWLKRHSIFSKPPAPKRLYSTHTR